jgi:hypothetical protein
MSRHPQYGQLGIDDLAAAARLAVFAHKLRGLQALGPRTPSRHEIQIAADPRAPGVVYPEPFDTSDRTVLIVFAHQYADLYVDWNGIAVTLWFHGQPRHVEIPFSAIVHVADNEAGLRLELPAARVLPDFHAAFRFALATLMVFNWGTDATEAELEGRAMFALLPAIVTRISKGTSENAASAVIIFDTGIIGVSLPPSVAAAKQDLMSFTLTPGDRGVRLRTDRFMIRREEAEGESWMIVPFVAVQKITIASHSLTLPFFPGPLADPLPDAAESPRSASGEGLDLTSLGKVTSLWRYPPGSPPHMIWEAGKFCLSGYVGRHSIPGLSFPEDLRERVPLGPSTTLEILIFDEPHHNAIAFKNGSRYCVGLYQGLILSIPSFAISLWTRPDVAPWIGDVSRLPPADEAGELPEGLDGLELEKIYFSKDDDFARIDQEALVAKKKALAKRSARLVAALDPIRRRAMQQCINDAFRYIWLHEIGHVVWGHLDLLERSTGALTISEIDDACEDALPPELGQFLEFQADRFAFGSVLDYRIGDLNRAAARGKLAAPGRGMPAFVDQATIAIMACVIAQLVFAANLKTRGREDVAGTHPPIWFRVTDMISEARAEFRGLELGEGTTTNEEIDRQLSDSMNRAVGSIVATHPMLAEVFQSFVENADGRGLAYGEAFELSSPRWDAIVRPYFKFYRREDGKVALRD